MKPKIVVIKLCQLIFIMIFINCNEQKLENHQKAKHKERELFSLEEILKEAKTQKDTLYFLWKKDTVFDFEKKAFYYQEPIYNYEEKGIIFNIHNGKSYESFLFEDGSVSETLKICSLKNYKIDSISKFDSINKLWIEKNKEVAKKMYGNTVDYNPRIVNENFAYVVYIIKIADDKKTFTIYPVIWRNFDYTSFLFKDYKNEKNNNVNYLFLCKLRTSTDKSQYFIFGNKQR